MTQATTVSVHRKADGSATFEEAQIQLQEILSAILSAHSGDADATYTEAGLVQHFPTSGMLKLHDGTSFLECLTPTSVGPVDSAASGSKGQFWLHATGIDICVAPNTWLRLAGASF